METDDFINTECQPDYKVEFKYQVCKECGPYAAILINAIQKLLHISLKRGWNRYEGFYFARKSYRGFAEYFGLNRKTVERAMRKLVDKGYLIVIIPRVKSGDHTFFYTLTNKGCRMCNEDKDKFIFNAEAAKKCVEKWNNRNIDNNKKLSPKVVQGVVQNGTSYITPLNNSLNKESKYCSPSENSPPTLLLEKTEKENCLGCRQNSLMQCGITRCILGLV